MRKSTWMALVVALFVVGASTGSDPATACSGDDCGCGIEAQECFASCPQGDQACRAACRQAWIDCGIACCGGGTGIAATSGCDDASTEMTAELALAVDEAEPPFDPRPEARICAVEPLGG